MALIHIRGPLLTQSGYGVHSRQIFKWALTRGHDIVAEVTPWGITPWYISRDECDGLVGQIMDRTGPLSAQPDISIQIQLPNEWTPKVGKKTIGITAGIETDICSQEWINCCRQMDQVIVPSRFTKQTFVDCGYKNIKVVHESFYDQCIDNDITGELIQDGLDIIKTEKNFLMLGQITGPDSTTDRKNTFDTIKWFVEAYADKPYGLIVKTNSGTNCKIDKHVTRKKLKTLVDGIRPKNSKVQVYLLHGSLNQGEVASLYKNSKISAFLSATRGEGFGLPLLEAAASGLPVIATNWSGHKDFLDLGKWGKIKKTLVPVPPSRIDGTIFVPGAKWAQPDQNDFVKKINYFLKNEEKAKTNAQLLRDRVAEKYSFASIAKEYDNVLGNL